jgi:hypothetical protein
VDTEDIRKMLSEIERDKEIRDLRRRLAEKEAEIEPAHGISKIRQPAKQSYPFVSS